MSSELYDKLILRMVFAIFLLAMIYLYRYFHKFLYPSSRNQMFKGFDPHKNPADTIHYFSRILGIAIIFSQFSFSITNNIWLGMLDFFIQSCFMFFLYLGAIFILESITLYNFEYQDEIVKKNNFSYAIICSVQALSLAYLIKTMFQVSQGSLLLFFFLWLFTIVIIGFATRSYSLTSRLPFNQMVNQKDIGLAISYLGFFCGWSILIGSALSDDLKGLGISSYSIQVILKVLLSLIILPIFRKGLTVIFNIKIKEDLTQPASCNLGQGIYEGTFFFSACLLTSIITGQIHFGSFYPVF